MSEEGNISGHDEDGLLAAEFVLGVLPPDERAAVAGRLAVDAELRAEVRFWQARLASLDTQFAEAPAPAGVWPRLERRLFAGAGGAAPGIWNSLRFWRGLTAVAASVAMLAIAIEVGTPRPDPKAFAAELVAALSAQGSNVQVVALYNASTGQVRITPISGDVVPNKDYELWAIEGQEAPKSLGVIPIDSRKDVVIRPDILAGFGSGTTLAITLEQKGGSPTGKAQGPIVAAGKATPI